MSNADLKFVQHLSRAASERRLHALLIGGHAVNMHGVSRFTEDFDFLIPRSNLETWRTLLGELGFTSFREGPNFAQFARDIDDGPKRLDLMMGRSGST
jgi:hypothetical protein